MLKLNYLVDCKCCVFIDNCCIEKDCTYSYRYQSIIGRDGDLYGVEILSTPNSGQCSSTEEYFQKIDVTEQKKLLEFQILNININQENIKKITERVFINIERQLLLDNKVVDVLIYFSNYFKKNNIELILEITERKNKLDSIIKENFYKLLLEEISFAADDYSKENNTHDLLTQKYKFIKFEYEYIIKNMIKNFNKFTDELYTMKESGIILIAEKIQTAEEFKLVKSMPFDLFQGFHIDKLTSN